MVQLIRRQDPLGNLPGIFQQAMQAAIDPHRLHQYRGPHGAGGGPQCAI